MTDQVDLEAKQTYCERKWAYNTRMKCCEGQAHFAPSPRIKYQCCKSRAFVPTSQLCCGDEVQSITVTGMISLRGKSRAGIKKCCAGTNVSKKYFLFLYSIHFYITQSHRHTKTTPTE